MNIQPGVLILGNNDNILCFICITDITFSTLIACDFRINQVKITPYIHNDWLRAAAYKEIKT